MYLLMRLGLRVVGTVYLLASISGLGRSQDLSGDLRWRRPLDSNVEVRKEHFAGRPLSRPPKYKLVKTPREVDGWESNEVLESIKMPNILFVKAHKVGSTSMMNHIRLIAARNGGHPREYMYQVLPGDFYGKEEAQPLEDGLHVWTNHAPLKTLLNNSVGAVVDHSFRITLVRDPLDRCLSSFYYYNASMDERWGQYTEEERMEEQLKVKSCGKSFNRNSLMGEVEVRDNSTIEETLKFYHVVGVTARFTETLTIIKMALGLRYGDMLGFDGKVSGLRKNQHLVERVPVSKEPPRVLEHFRSLIDPKDHDLHFAANLLLDRTIQRLQPNFEEVHANLIKHLFHAQAECRRVPLGYTRLERGFGCFASGTCRLECLNNYASKNHLWEIPDKRFEL